MFCADLNVLALLVDLIILSLMIRCLGLLCETDGSLIRCAGLFLAPVKKKNLCMFPESTEAAPVKKKNLCMSSESTEAATKNRRRIDVLGKYWSSPCQEEESMYVLGKY